MRGAGCGVSTSSLCALARSKNAAIAATQKPTFQAVNLAFLRLWGAIAHRDPDPIAALHVDVVMTMSWSQMHTRQTRFERSNHGCRAEVKLAHRPVWASAHRRKFTVSDHEAGGCQLNRRRERRHRIRKLVTRKFDQCLLDLVDET